MYFIIIQIYMYKFTTIKVIFIFLVNCCTVNFICIISELYIYVRISSLMPAIMNIHRCQGEEQVKVIDEVGELFKIQKNELNGKKFFGWNTIRLIDIMANFIDLYLPIIQEKMGIQLVNKEKLPIF